MAFSRRRNTSRGGLAPHLPLILALAATSTVLAAGPPAGVSSEEWASIEQQIDVERHKITASDQPGRLYRADNPSQRFTAHFGAEDVVIEPSGRGAPAWHLGLRLTAWGAADDLEQVEFAHSTAEGNRVEYRRGLLTEWYVNTSMGLEQGFTIDAPPGDDITELVLEMALDSDLTPILAEGGRAITLQRKGSTTLLGYSGLAAWDAVGEPLEARMELAGGDARLRLVVTVAGAAWPIIVDPTFAFTARLLPTPHLDLSWALFGTSVAMDGDLIVVGSLQSNGLGPLTAHVFRRGGGSPVAWDHVAEIRPDDNPRGEEISVAIDGDTVILGSPDTFPECAYIFRQNQGGPDAWGRVAKITSGGDPGSEFGFSVAVNGDTAVVGAPQRTASTFVFGRHQGGPDSWGLVAEFSPVGFPGGFFGSSVAISGDTAVVGQPLDRENGTESGAAYVFERNLGGPNTWGQAARIVVADASEHARFGSSVSLDGDVAMVGAWGDRYIGPATGSAYLFQRDHGGPGAWGQLSKLIASDNSTYDHFGSSVAIDGGLAVAGAPYEGGPFPASGSVYVYQRDEGGAGSWGEQDKVLCPPLYSAITDLFGQAVAISDTTIAVGAPDYGTGFGYVHVFEREGSGAGDWNLVAMLRPENAEYDGRFGDTLDISGDTLVVGAYKADDYGTDSGTAYVFVRDHGGSNAWGQLATLVPDDAQLKAFFGSSISINGDTVAVGAPGDDWFPGTTYIFQRDHGGPEAWGQVAKLRPSDLSGFEDRFGWSTAISGDTVISGSPWYGAAYVFERDNGGPDAWGETAKITEVGGWIVALDRDTAVIDRGGELVVVERDQGGPDSWGQTARITHPGGGYHISHGRQFAINGDIVVIGAPYDTVNNLETGSAYAFQRDAGGPNAWGQIARVVPYDGQEDDGFGFSVDFAGDALLVGAPGSCQVDLWSGSAYLYVFPTSPTRRFTSTPRRVVP